MIELYSVKETARLFGLSPSQLRYWTQTGFVSPSVRRSGRLFYTFRDLISVKAAADLVGSGMTIEQARPSVRALRESLPTEIHPGAPLTIRGDGSGLEIIGDNDSPSRRELVVAFRLRTLATHIAESLERPGLLEEMDRSPEPEQHQAVPSQTDDELSDGTVTEVVEDTGELATQPHPQPSAYECFRTGYRAEQDGDLEIAEAWYLRALSLEPTLAAAHTNLGNVLYARGALERSRQAYETALDYDPDQPEARYNLGNLLDELGETELAIAELRQVVSRHPGFADAHYNLGLALFRVGGLGQAKDHLARYLELDPRSEWASRARSFLDEGSAAA